MKYPIKLSIIFTAVYLALSGHAWAAFHFDQPIIITQTITNSNDSSNTVIVNEIFTGPGFHFNDPNFNTGSGNSDHGDHHHFGSGGGSGGGNPFRSHFNSNPEPVSSILFLFGAGILALRYSQRRLPAFA